MQAVVRIMRAASTLPFPDPAAVEIAERALYGYARTDPPPRDLFGWPNRDRIGGTPPEGATWPWYGRNPRDVIERQGAAMLERFGGVDPGLRT